MDTSIRFTLNGKSRTVLTDPNRPLLDVLREDLHLTGTKYGCGEGECRACTVLLNGESTPSCLTPVGDVNGQKVLTIEGLSTGTDLHPVQEAFLSEGAFQCGYCTAGMILGVVGVMNKNPQASEADVLSELQHHLCRCCSYTKYVEAVRHIVAASDARKAQV